MQSVAATSSPLPTSDSTPLAGARIVLMCLVALAPLVATLAGSGAARVFSAITFAAFVGLIPAALYVRRGAFYLALASAILLLASLPTIPLDSIEFAADRWSSLVMFLLALTAFPKPAAEVTSRS